jgi:hypothetical protein
MEDNSRFKLTKLGKSLRTDEEFSTRWCSIFVAEDALDRQRQMFHEVKTGEEAHHKAWGEGEDLFSHLSKRPKCRNLHKVYGDFSPRP